MNSDNSNELLPIVDPDGRQTGTATRGECHSGVGKPLHPVVHLHLFDPQGRLYLQRRPEWKDIQASGTPPWGATWIRARP